MPYWKASHCTWDTYLFFSKKVEAIHYSTLIMLQYSRLLLIVKFPLEKNAILDVK